MVFNGGERTAAAAADGASSSAVALVGGVSWAPPDVEEKRKRGYSDATTNQCGKILFYSADSMVLLISRAEALGF